MVKTIPDQPPSMLNGKQNPAYHAWWRERNRERTKGYHHNRLKNDATYADRKRDSGRKHYHKNKKKRLANTKAYKMKDPEAFRARTRFLSAQRRKANPMLIIRDRLTQQLRRAIIAAKSGKFVSVVDLVGCTMSEFMTYIEGKFTGRMSWKNMGRWHLDHIIPMASFIPFDLEAQRKAFHYSNYQPLWGKKNREKSDTMPSGISFRVLNKMGKPPVLKVA